MKNLQKNESKKTKIIPTTQCEDDFYYYLYTLGLSIYHAADSMLPSPPLFLFLQTKGRKIGMIGLHRGEDHETFSKEAHRALCVSVSVISVKIKCQ